MFTLSFHRGRLSACEVLPVCHHMKRFLFLCSRVLLVDRQESRPGEWLARKFFGAVSAVCTSSMSVPIQAVAKAMVSNTLLQPEKKTEILENKAIAALGKRAQK